MPNIEGQEEEDTVGLCVVKIVPVYFLALHALIMGKDAPHAVHVEVFLHGL